MHELRPVSQVLFGPVSAIAMDGTAFAGGTRPTTPRRHWYAEYGKRLLDVTLVLLSMPIALLIISVCAAILWLESGSPFYRQARIGKGGRVFRMIKLRTMVPNAEARLKEFLKADPKLDAEWRATQKLKNDPRVTRVGRILRATSLDELPQLFNVLKGDMSLVGPRPMMTDQLELYGNPRAYYALRPGITGVWQVSGRNETTFSYRSVLDSKYLSSLTFKNDVRLLLKTVDVVIRRTGY